MTQETTPSPLTQQFVERLQELDRGDLAILRRNAGLSLNESRKAVGLFYRLMPVHLGPQEEIYFLLATLYPLNDGQAPNGDFGSSFAQLRMKRESESLDRRMNILLDSDFDWDAQGRLKGGELGFRLRQAVKLLASEDIGVNWVVLLEDLLRWSHPDKYIQKRWARSYYGTVNRQAEKEA